MSARVLTLRILAIAALLALASRHGAAEEEPPSARTPLEVLAELGEPRPNPERVWTVLVYLAADCNLEEYILDDLNEIEAGLPEGGRVEVVVLLDRADGHDVSDGDWKDARVLRVRRDGDPEALGAELLASPGELDLGDAATLETFVAAALRAFPARRYALFMGGHGSGWLGTMPDDAAPAGPPVGSGITADRLAPALRSALDAAGVERLALLAMDACLMAQLEVLAELEGTIDILVASEAKVPGPGLPYDRILPLFATDANPADLAQDIVAAFGDDCDDKDDYRSTLAALDLTRTTPIIEALRALFTKLDATLAVEWPDVCRSIWYSESYMGRADFAMARGAVASIDLLDFTKRIAASLPEDLLSAEAASVASAVEQAVIASYRGDVRRLSRGLALHAPLFEESLRPEYAALRLGRETGWPGLLAKLHLRQKQELKPPEILEFRVVDREGEETQAMLAAAHEFRFTVRGKNILWTLFEHGRPAKDGMGTEYYLRSFVFDRTYDDRMEKAAAEAAELADVVMPAYVDGDNPLREPFPGLVFEVSDGERTYPATVYVDDPSDLRHVRVPILFALPGEELLPATLIFDGNWMDADSVEVSRARPGLPPLLIRYVQPPDGARVVPLVEVARGDETEMKGAGETTWGKGLTLVPTFLEPGKMTALIASCNLSGQTSTRSFGYEVQTNELFDLIRKDTDPLRPADLLGEWRFEMGVYDTEAGNYAFADTGATLRLFESEDVPAGIGYGLRGGEIDVNGFALLQGGKVPNLMLFAKADLEKDPLLLSYLRPRDEGHVRSDFFLPFFWKKGNRKALVLWEPYRMQVFRAQPRGRELIRDRELRGLWRTADGSVAVKITATRFTTYFRGVTIDEGAVHFHRDKLICVSVRNAKIVTYSYEISGNALSLDSPALRLDLHRVR